MEQRRGSPSCQPRHRPAASRRPSDSRSPPHRTSHAYSAVDEALVQARITGLITGLDAALGIGEIELFQHKTAAAIRQRLAGGFAPADILAAVEEVERAVEELVVEHEKPHAVGTPR